MRTKVGTSTRIVLALVLATGVFTARAQDATPAAASAKADDSPGKSYVYKQSGGQPRQMEIFFPANRTPAQAKAPGLILFHGGNWTDGSLVGYREVCRYFASRGLVAATADYRMLPLGKDKDPESGLTRKQVCVRDGKSAIRWLKQHAEELGVDPARIIVGGGSAGGHIAVLASTTPDLDDPSDPPGIDASVAAYVLWCPACTEADANDPPIDARRHVGKNFAPAVVFFGTEDSWLKHWKNLTKYSIRPRGGTEPVLWYAPGVDHSGLERNWRPATLAAADQFLVERGLLTGACTLTPPDNQKLVKAAGVELTPVQPTPGAAEPKPAVAAEPAPAVAIQPKPGEPPHDLGKRDAKPEVGPTWIQNARARVEFEMKPATAGKPVWWTLRYFRWDATAGAWTPFLHRAGIGANIKDVEILKRVRAENNVYWLFEGVPPTCVTTAVENGSAYLSYRLERGELWAEYRLTLLGDTPYLRMEQFAQSRPDMTGTGNIVLSQPMQFAVTDKPFNDATKYNEYTASEHQTVWNIRFQRYFAAYSPDKSSVCGIFTCDKSPENFMLIVHANVFSVLQPEHPMIFVGDQGPAERTSAAMRQWAADQMTALEAFRTVKTGKPAVAPATGAKTVQ